MRRPRHVALPALLVAAACSKPSTTQAVMSDSTTNPFLSRSTLTYQAPPFDKIRNEHYQPAIEQGMQENLAEIDAIARQEQVRDGVVDVVDVGMEAQVAAVAHLGVHARAGLGQPELRRSGSD